jgi:putative hemolysin
MATAMQTIGKLAVVLAVAVLLLGGLATPAGATPRSQGVSKANDYVLSCTQMGGDPVVVMDSTGENLTVMCRWPDGRVAVCQFLPVAKDCQWVTPLKASDRSRSGGAVIATK